MDAVCVYVISLMMIWLVWALIADGPSAFVGVGNATCTVFRGKAASERSDRRRARELET